MTTPENNGRNPENGRFAVGNPGKPKGAIMHASLKVKTAIVTFLENNVEKIQESFDKLDDEKKLKFIADILPYAAPKLAAIQTEHTGEVDQHITITWAKPQPGELPDFSNESSVDDAAGNR